MRLTTDTPKNNTQTALNLFYVKDKETWVRGYGENGADITLFDLIRKIVRRHTKYAAFPETMSDSDISFTMAEWLVDGTDSIEGVLALLYQAAWVCAELREHLKQFEDVAHGRWIPIPEYENKRCSACRTVFSEFTLGHYCPNCGARMDGGDSNA
jgi:hypothetical protein